MDGFRLIDVLLHIFERLVLRVLPLAWRQFQLDSLNELSRGEVEDVERPLLT